MNQTITLHYIAHQLLAGARIGRRVWRSSTDDVAAARRAVAVKQSRAKSQANG